MASTILSDNGVTSGVAGLKTSADSDGTLALQTTTAGGTATTAVTINTSQNVGIGTSTFTSGSKLAVQTTAGKWEVISDGSVSVKLKNGGGLTIDSAIGHYFNQGATEFARIDSSGNLLVGTTSGVTTEKVNFTQTADGPALMAVCSNASQSASGIVYARAARNTTNNSFYAFSYFNTGAVAFKFVVADSGNVTNTNNSYGAISDVKLKENIVDATPKLEDLCKVKVRQYNLKSDPSHKQLGVIAQELEEVFAGMVEEFSDKDADGNDLGTTTKSVKYSVFIPMLIKSIQEQQALITAQAETINALTARIAALEGK